MASQKSGREAEWQLGCADLSPVRRWLADHGSIDGLALEPHSPVEIFETYFDTDDWRIHRAGFALRIRSESGKTEATLKSIDSATGATASRRELSETLEKAGNDAIRYSNGPVGLRVHAVSGEQALLPLFEVRTSRQRFLVRREDQAQPLGAIALDDTIISRPSGEHRTAIQHVGVEALTAAQAPLQSLVKSLRADCALEANPGTKYARALEAVGLAPPPASNITPAAIDASMSMAEVALANLRHYLSAWHVHEPGARLGDDPDELHDLRVAGRRLDALLRQFRTFLPEPFLRIRPTLKNALRSIGEVRDLDVLLQKMEAFSQALPKAERQSIKPLKQHLSSERGRARTRMLGILDSAAVHKDFHELTTLLGASMAASPPPSPNLALNCAPEIIRRRYRKMRKGADRLSPDSSVEAYHMVRGQVKKLRYALEAVMSLYGKPAAEMLRALRRWQETLGVQQDAAVANRRMKAIAAAPPKSIPPETLFSMGQLAEHYAGAAARARQLHPKRYKKVRTRWKRLRVRFEASVADNAANHVDSAEHH